MRVHVPYLAFLSTILGHKRDQFIIRWEAENVSSSFVTVGVVSQSGGWHVTPRIRLHDGRRFLDAVVAFASQVFRTERVVSVRACRGIRIMLKLPQYEHGDVIVWIRAEGGDSLGRYTPCTKDLTSPFPAQSLAQELDEVDIGRKDWGEVCFVQFLCIKLSNAPVVLSVAPRIFVSAGVGAHSLRVKTESPVEDDAPTTTHGNRLDIALWLLPKQVDHQKVPYRQGHERPIEGITTSAKPNKNVIAVIEGRSTKVQSWSTVVEHADHLPCALSAQWRGGVLMATVMSKIGMKEKVQRSLEV